ncbi:putative phospholipid-transporting ATPase DNF3 [Nakaseomyces glabratus]|uniref:Phospholipid-transporting ATPase n=1 Tax=Candida glabrata TaxID=5478 RepID=A0A0W0CUT0_CANGB|nr:putative phospholipid-transporting ATPase DNF3 [Nakaseomyces glabratus]KTB03134.1 putative phospholipid-transporting ATPase DNF3 [Nakaseomyces glabratus]KTB04078.1 putative phospholipid-transporting ATPase DNF3 [Nakaseomyces glabratus]KTB20939.1 putative phospholipid-transporting ATPase DNF3 [Nakaseomyces glabratus]
MTEPDKKRKRSWSLRTQMFNKHLFENYNNDDNVEMNDIDEETENDEGHIGDFNSIDGQTKIRNHQSPRLVTKILDMLFDRRTQVHSVDGRHIPISLDHSSAISDIYPVDRHGNLVDERYGYAYCNNLITSSRYTIISFFPRQLYAQFSKLANVYFFIVAILQMIPGWSTTGTYTTIVPLCVFMAISMAREAYDDYRRHKLDKEENNKLTKVLQILHEREDNDLDLENNAQHLANNPESISNLYFNNFDLLAKKYNVRIVEKKWKDIRVGDFVLLQQDDWVPADILILTSDGDNSEVFIETMALDGETNLKGKVPHPEINKLTKSASGLANINAQVTVEDPNNDLYNFEGNLELNSGSSSKKKYPLGPDNVIYRGSIIRNTRNCVGMVIFTGEESKIRMNALRNPRTKAPKLQRKINMIVVFMVFVVACMSLFSYLGHTIQIKRYVNNNKAWYLLQEDAGTAPTIMSFIIMYNTIIPLSLYVTMELIKVAQSRMMEWDIDMYHAESDTPCAVRTATILEELGQVSYIFSDKTGTLTDNKMLFRKLSFCGTSWVHNATQDISEFKPAQLSKKNDIDVISIDDQSFLSKLGYTSQSNPKRYMDINDFPDRRTSVEYKGNATVKYTGRPSMRSLYVPPKKETNVSNSQDASDIPEDIKSTFELIYYIQSNPKSLFAKKAKMFILSLAICHICLPKRTEEGNDEDDIIEYQSSSPDELALVTAARDMGYIVYNRNANILTLKTFPDGFDELPRFENFEILELVDFNSQRKRMSVIVRVPEEKDRVLLFCKGADNVILERLHNKEMALDMLDQVENNTKYRKDAEAELVIQHRKSLERAVNDDLPRTSLRNSISRGPRESLSLQAARKSMSRKSNRLQDPEMQLGTIDQFLDSVQKTDKEIDAVVSQARKSLAKQRLEKYGPRLSMDSPQIVVAEKSPQVSNGNDVLLNYIGSDALISNEEYVLEKTLEDIESFSTEGLRTLLFAHKWISNEDFEQWRTRYHEAKTSLSERKQKIDEVGAQIEDELYLLGATAIEDKLQEGVSEAIEKIRRAGIKMWMLTGDKRETAINIGYSCKLIHDYSTVVILTTSDENIISKMNAISQEVDSGNVAHCVIVIDGATLAMFEDNPTLMSVFTELCTKTDSVVCCRASPAQKALMVSNIRNTDKSIVTLAIGDGANDIAMIQSADIGVGIAGKEGLQASRSADYSIGQFRFILKLLLVHGRYNYIRTAKFILCTFYKELTFYLTQLIYQRYTMFSGTSLYEPWSLSMYNTLFTSLPVLCVGMFEKDLKPVTLLTVPELYSMGRLSKAFNWSIFAEWVFLGTANALIITFLNIVAWGETSLSDNTLYPLGFVNFSATVALINVKAQFIEMRNRNWLAFTSVILSCGGWLVWCCALPILNRSDGIYDVTYGLYHHFGRDITFWCTSLILAVLPIIVDVVYKTFKIMLAPSDSDIFAELEQKSEIRKKLELGAYNEMKQGWTWTQDQSTFDKYKDIVFNRSRSASSATEVNSMTNLAHGNSEDDQYLSSRFANDDIHTSYSGNSATSPPKPTRGNSLKLLSLNITGNSRSSEEYEVLPSGKLIKRQSTELQKATNNSENMASKLTKKLRFKMKDEEDDEEIDRIIRDRMKDLE